MGGVVGQEGGIETCAVNVRVHKMHKCTHEWDTVCLWYSASVQRPLVRWLTQSRTVEQCSHVMVHCLTWSTAKLSTVRIIYMKLNHTGSAVMCVHVHVCVCACVRVHTRDYIHCV